MDNLRLILIVVATLAIVALLIHGFWINKKERSNLFCKPDRPSSANRVQDNPVESEDDISAVRVVPATGASVVPTELSLDAVEKRSASPLQQDLFSVAGKTVMPVFPTENENVLSADPIIPLSITEAEETAVQKPAFTLAGAADVLVMHVVGINGTNLHGATLLTSILGAGFQYGDMQIFHRYVDPAGNGSVLFSLANMVKPGYLQPESMDEMITPGISLFMMIPSFGDDQQNFKMMLQSAQRIADDVKGVVLDDEHHMLTPQKIDDYKERIKKLTVQ